MLLGEDPRWKSMDESMKQGISGNYMFTMQIFYSTIEQEERGAEDTNYGQGEFTGQVLKCRARRQKEL